MGHVWHLRDTLSAGISPSERDLRVCQGLPAEVVAQCRRRAEQQRCGSLLEEARTLLRQNDPDSLQRLARIVDELREFGRGVEAALLIAEAARTQDRLLWELDARLAIVLALGEVPAALPSLYALADLLALLGEPALAIDYFEKVRKLNADYRDAGQRIAQLRAHPLLEAPGAIRADLPAAEGILPELEKCTLIGRPFRGSVVFAAQLLSRVRRAIDAAGLCRALTELKAGQTAEKSPEVTAAVVYDGAGILRADWIRLRHPEKALPIVYALEVQPRAGGAEITEHCLFEAGQIAGSATATAAEHNALVQETWVRSLNSSAMKSWIADIHTAALSAIKMALGQAAAQGSEDMY